LQETTQKGSALTIKHMNTKQYLSCAESFKSDKERLPSKTLLAILRAETLIMTE